MTVIHITLLPLEHFFVFTYHLEHLLSVCSSLLTICPLSCLVSLFLMICRCSSYVLDTNPFSDIFCKTSCQPTGPPFSLLTMSLRTNALNLRCFQFFFFFSHDYHIVITAYSTVMNMSSHIFFWKIYYFIACIYICILSVIDFWVWCDARTKNHFFHMDIQLA